MLAGAVLEEAGHQMARKPAVPPDPATWCPACGVYRFAWRESGRVRAFGHQRPLEPVELDRETRSRWNRVMSSKPHQTTVRIAGMNHDNPDGSSRRLVAHKAWDIVAREGLAWATLRAEPGNPHHENAIEVLLDGERLGYLPREIADGLAAFGPDLATGIECVITEALSTELHRSEAPGIRAMLRAVQQLQKLDRRPQQVSRGRYERAGDPAEEATDDHLVPASDDADAEP
jgi:hypothetical protein